MERGATGKSDRRSSWDGVGMHPCHHAAGIKLPQEGLGGAASPLTPLAYRKTAQGVSTQLLSLQRSQENSEKICKPVTQKGL